MKRTHNPTYIMILTADQYSGEVVIHSSRATLFKIHMKCEVLWTIFLGQYLWKYPFPMIKGNYPNQIPKQTISNHKQNY